MVDNYKYHSILEYKDPIFAKKNGNEIIYGEYIFTYFIKKNLYTFAMYLTNYIRLNFLINIENYSKVKNILSNLENNLINIKFNLINKNQVKILIEIEINHFLNDSNLNIVFNQLNLNDIYKNLANKIDLYRKLIELYYKTFDYEKEDILKKILIENKNIISAKHEVYTTFATLLLDNINIIDMITSESHIDYINNCAINTQC